jgi:hypothetical protein
MSGRNLVLMALAAVLVASGMVLGRATSSGEGGTAADVPADGTPAHDRPTPPRAPTVNEDEQRTVEGAVAAATRFVVLVDGPEVLDPTSRRELFDEIAASEERDQLDETFAEVSDLLADVFGLTPQLADDPGFVIRAVPAGWRVASYTPDEATVSVWATGVLVAEGRQLSQPGWRTLDVTVRWERDGWRLVRIDNQDGPTPPMAGAEGVAAIGRQIDAFEVFEHRAPERVD